MKRHTCATCKHFKPTPDKKRYLDGDCSFPTLEDTVKSSWAGCPHHSELLGGDQVQKKTPVLMLANIIKGLYATKTHR